MHDTGTVLYSFLRLELIPEGYLICNGQEYSKTDFPELYSVIKDKYGAALKPNMFKVPDLRGLYIIGTSDGKESGKILPAAMGKHKHNDVTTPVSGAHKNQYYLAKVGWWISHGSSGDSTKYSFSYWQKIPTSVSGAHTHAVTVEPSGIEHGRLNSFISVPLIKY